MATARHPKATYFVQRKLFSGLTSFAELESKIAALPDEQSRGAVFEVFAEAYLDADREPTKALSLWEKGLNILEEPKSGVLQKREITTRITAFAWAILAARMLKDDSKVLHYENEFETTGASIRNVSHPPRKPLFFSPISKVLVDFKRLKKEISQA